MKLRLKSCLGLIALTGACGLLSACEETTQTRLRVQDDFGQAVSQDLAAQIADPDAGRNAGPPPPSSGLRAEGAQKRYGQDAVIQPSGIGASGTSGGYGQNGAGAAPTAGAAATAGASTSAGAPSAGP